MGLEAATGTSVADWVTAASTALVAVVALGVGVAEWRRWKKQSQRDFEAQEREDHRRASQLVVLRRDGDLILVNQGNTPFVVLVAFVLFERNDTVSVDDLLDGVRYITHWEAHPVMGVATGYQVEGFANITLAAGEVHRERLPPLGRIATWAIDYQDFELATWSNLGGRVERSST
jgi:hypothetical protein